MVNATGTQSGYYPMLPVIEPTLTTGTIPVEQVRVGEVPPHPSAIQTMKSVVGRVTEFIKSRNIFGYVGLVVPGIQSLVALGRSIKELCFYVKAACFGLYSHVSSAVKSLVYALFDLVSSLVSVTRCILGLIQPAIPFLLQFFNIFGSVLSLVVSTWAIVLDAISLKRVGDAKKIIDKTMEKEELSTSQKAVEILEHFQAVKVKKQQKMEERLLTIKEEFRDRARKFMEAQIKSEMETRLGKYGYALVERGIEHLQRIEENPEAILKAIECVREVRGKLIEKSAIHWINIAATVTGVVATILGVIAPFLGPAAPVVTGITYGLWTVAVLGWAAAGVCSFVNMIRVKVAEKQEKAAEVQERAFLSQQGPSLDDENSSVTKVEDVLAAFHGTDLYATLDIQDKKKIIEETLGSHSKLNAYYKQARLALINQSKEEIRNCLLEEGVEGALAEKVLTIKTTKGLKAAIKKYRVELGPLLIFQLNSKVERIQAMTGASYRSALRLEWSKC